MKKLSTTMAHKRTAVKRGKEYVPSELPEIALAAVASYKKQKEVSDFINFLLSALDRNASWLNTIVNKQNDFKCAYMIGSGPNRFQLQEIIYPCGENDISLEVEMKDSEDYDKIAIAALLRVTNVEMEHLLTYVKNRLCENPLLKDDMVQGKALGISFAVLRPISDRQYRVTERIVIGKSIECVIPVKKRKRDERSTGPPGKKFRMQKLLVE